MNRRNRKQTFLMQFSSLCQRSTVYPFCNWISSLIVVLVITLDNFAPKGINLDITFYAPIFLRFLMVLTIARLLCIPYSTN